MKIHHIAKGGVSFRKFLLHKFVFCCSAFRKTWSIIM